MDYQHILCELDGPFMVLTLNRPDKLNAYTGVMGSEIEHAFRSADADDSVRAIIVTGAGRAFCAGADVSGGAASAGVVVARSAAAASGASRRTRAAPR